MQNQTRCPTCGGTLSEGVEDCPKCLLNLALETSSDADVDESAPTEETERHRLSEGSKVGPYTIQRELGEGGMGLVYLAEQSEPIQRQVALKVIKHGMDTRQVVKRFEAERQALAVMDHTSVAKVFDAGETESGRPYFEMEFIEGRPINEFCDEQRLGTTARLELFIHVCKGVQHAHQRGIIHRDLKPSNLLVTSTDDEVRPKIIDFGVAKATERSLTDHSAMTAMGVLLGTPEYMSPEQAELAPFDVDTRTDVYSLGVVLYELLTGALPVDRSTLRDASFDEVRRQIREVRPAKPSTRITRLGDTASETARARQTDVVSLRKRLAGDLDVIVLKALEKDRDRRYGSPAELAADIERHLANEPVLARPASALYQLRKLAARNKLVTGLLGLVVLLVIVGTAVNVEQTRRTRAERDRATREAETAKTVSRFLEQLFSSADPRVALGDEMTAKEMLDKGAGRVESELAGQPEVQARLFILLSGIYFSLGDYDESLRLLERGGETTAEVLAEDVPLDVERLRSLAWIHRMAGRQEEGLAAAGRAVERAEQGLDRGNPLFAETVTTQGVLLRDTREFDRAREAFDRAVAISREFLEPDSATEGWAFFHLGWLEFQQGNPEASHQAYERACPMLERVLEANAPGIAECLNDHTRVLQQMQRFDEAGKKQRRALEIWEHVLPPGHPRIAEGLTTLGTQHYFANDLEAAELHYRRALEIREQSLGPNHPYVGSSLNSLGMVYRQMKRDDEAIDYMLRGMAIVEQAEGPDSADVINTLFSLGFVYERQRRYEEALTLYDRAVESRERTHGPEHLWVAGALRAGALTRQRLGRHDEACRAYERALGISAANFPPENRGHQDMTIGTARCYLRQGRTGDARRLIDAVVASSEEAGTRGGALAYAHYLLARLARGDGDGDAADAHLEQSIAIRTELQPEGSSAESYAQAVLFAHQGEIDHALDSLEESIEFGYHPPDVDRDVDFAPLAGNARFERLLQR